ncbi:unnamed protein product [Moneuplotes crassus]|uniref:EamA domain-containing protein n=1 Tax=Euplotes crassus TaxID=5936 RepID=A0AAD1XEN3_EUPCR|nr:unnamed protein product [Moneuplotes crassus]
MRSFETSQLEQEQTGTKQDKNMVVGTILTVVALLAGSAIIPLVDEYKGVPFVLRTLWRCQLLVIYCLPIGAYFCYINRADIDLSKVFTMETLLEFLCSAFLWTTGSSLLLHSSDYTLVSHTSILVNLGGICIVCFNIIRGTPVHKLEIIGTIFVIISVVICINDSSSSKTNDQTNIVLGDIIGLICSPIFGLYFVVSARLLKKLPSICIVEVSFTIQFFITSAFYICFYDIKDFYSFDIQYGILGWASSEYLLYSLTAIGIITGVFGIGGYVFTLNYFPPHIVGTIYLLEPVVGQILGIILGQDNMPGIFTYVGTFGIMAGLALSIKGDLMKAPKASELQDKDSEKNLSMMHTPSKESIDSENSSLEMMLK